jgi:hypothetical protein
MANQAIALQARAPQGNFLAPAIQQGAQFINMMSQQRAAERQAAVQQQQMDMQRASAAREAELQPDRVKKAAYEALSSQQKAVLEFFDLAAEGVKQSRTPEDAVKIGQFLKSSFNSPELQGIVDQTLSSMPSDPALWPEWKKQTELQSLDSKDRLTEEFTTQNLGTSTRIVATPKFGGGVSRVVPGSEVDLGEEITYVKGPNGEVIPMPKRMAPAGGGLVGGDRGGVAATPVATALQTNPGAIRDGAFARSQPGYAGVSGGFATFNTPQAGVAAQENLLRGSYVAKGFNTINKIIDRYSPAGGENAPAAVANYKAYVARRAGIDASAPITAAQVPVVAAAMREFETGQRSTGAPAVAPAAGGGVQFGVPVPGTGGKPKDLTVQEQTSSYNISRLLRGAAAIKKAVETSPSANVPGATEAVVGSLPFISGAVNFTRGPQRQIVAAAQRDVLDALLYLATGAAYNKEQLEGQMESYIPAFSDAPEAIESKRERLAQLVMDAKTRAGRAWTPKLDEAANTLFGPTAAAAAPAAAAPPPAAIQMLRKNPTPAERKMFDSVFGAGAAAKALGGR